MPLAEQSGPANGPDLLNKPDRTEAIATSHSDGLPLNTLADSVRITIVLFRLLTIRQRLCSVEREQLRADSAPKIFCFHLRDGSGPENCANDQNQDGGEKNFCAAFHMLCVLSKPHLPADSCINFSTETSITRLNHLKISRDAKPSHHGEVVESLHALLIA